MSSLTLQVKTTETETDYNIDCWKSSLVAPIVITVVFINLLFLIFSLIRYLAAGMNQINVLQTC